MTPLYFHIINVCLHCAATCLLMHTCERYVFEKPRLAFITALLFAVHPVHTEAVSGIVGRADVLACLLFLLTFHLYIRSVDQCVSEDSFPSTVSPGSLLLSLFLGTCAMLVKETGITVFGVCLLYDALSGSHGGPQGWPLIRLIPQSDEGKFSLTVSLNLNRSVASRRPADCLCLLLRGLRSSRLRDLPLLCKALIKRVGLISAYVVIIMSVRLWLMGGSMPLFSEQDNPASFSPHLLTRFLTYSFLLSFNAWLLLAPIVLCYDWQVGSIPLVESVMDVRNMATMLLAVVMVALCWRCLQSLQENREVLVGMLFLVFPFIPASNLFFRVGFVVAERVLYMPSMGYCILVAHGLGRLWSTVGRWGTTLLSVCMLLLILLFSLKTVQQNNVWLSREALFRLYPRHASALNNLGTLTSSADEAEHFYRKALDINPQHNRALFNLGNLLKSQGNEEEAEALLKDSIRYGPHFADAYSSLASLYAEQRRFAEANQMYLEGIESCPDSSDLHNNYGVFLVDTGEFNCWSVCTDGALLLQIKSSLPELTGGSECIKDLHCFFSRSSPEHLALVAAVEKVFFLCGPHLWAKVGL
uniref:dolichyl-phosphate-mannose--protein mannosyltransferase n=1 Tax=Cyprinodon variegatus TaxID=28743 RepID=A0A3Q2FM55_CYPVA